MKPGPGPGPIAVLAKSGLRIFTTSDFVTLTGLSPVAASQALIRLSRRGMVGRARKAVWFNKLAAGIHPYEVVPYLRAPWPAYVSLFSALSDAGVVEEVPHVVYAVSSALPKRYSTELADFDIRHLPSHLIWGYTMRTAGPATFPIADPEKAFLDQIYLALTPRARMGFPVKRTRKWNLDPDKLASYARRFNSEKVTAWLRAQGILGPSPKIRRSSGRRAGTAATL